MIGYKLGMIAGGVALGGPSNLIDGNPGWKREIKDIVDKALIESKGGVFSDSAGKKFGNFIGGEFRFADDDVPHSSFVSIKGLKDL